MRPTIVIASVLKPADDVRAYMKIAQSLAQANKYEINIIGNEGKKDRTDNKIKFHTHTINRTQWLKRLWIREQLLFKILKLKPKLLIITTHELINTALILKLLIGCKVIYDIQENYARNVLLKPGIPSHLISFLIRLKELAGSRFIDYFLLAEKSYKEELSFVKKKFSILENKAKKIKINRTLSNQQRFLFSGTISDYGGVRIAVEIMKEFEATSMRISEVIILESNLPEYAKSIKRANSGGYKYYNLIFRNSWRREIYLTWNSFCF